MRALILVFGLMCVGRLAVADAPGATGSTARHLLAGVRAFQHARYEEALVELRVVARAPDAPADLAFYLGPTLYKLGRYRDALQVFVTSQAPADALTRFYLGETCYQLQLYRRARTIFIGLQSAGLGPALDEAAARYVASVDLAYGRAPEVAAIDVYLAEGRGLAASDPVVAGEYLEEAREVEALARAPHRHDEIIAALGEAWNASGHAQAVIDVLATERTPTTETRWQLARAYVSVGDVAHARVLLDALVRAATGHAEEAAAVRAKLAR